MDEEDFLQAILSDPKDDAALLSYSDWLEEQGDPGSAAKAEFLRLMVELAGRQGGPGWGGRQRLWDSAAALDPEWLAVVSRLPIANCARKRTARGAPAVPPPSDLFLFRCDRKWEDLQPTDERGVRRCQACQQGVHYCATPEAIQQHAQQGHCIAVDLGLDRRAERRSADARGVHRRPPPWEPGWTDWVMGQPRAGFEWRWGGVPRAALAQRLGGPLRKVQRWFQGLMAPDGTPPEPS